MTVQSYKTVLALCTLGASLALASCGGDSSTPSNVPPVSSGTGDFLSVSVNGGPATNYAEASGLPQIDCDPRVDWAFNQVVGWANFTGGSGPSGYDMFFDIIFALDDTVGTYTVQGDFLQVLLYNGESYLASPAYATTSGTVDVTRADTRIEGTYNVVAVDSTGTTYVNFAGTFGVEQGVSLSCSN